MTGSKTCPICGAVFPTWFREPIHCAHDGVDWLARTIPRAARASPNLWLLLHTSTKYSSEWFFDWLSRVPKSCGCHNDLPEVVARAEMDFSSLAAFHASGWRLHNIVNEKLGKSVMPFPDAAAMYGWNGDSRELPRDRLESAN